MSLTTDRIQSITTGFINYLHVRRQLAQPPHRPTQREVRRVLIWTGLFSVNARLHGVLMEVLRRRGGILQRARDAGLEAMLNGLDKSREQHDDPDLQRQALDLTPESLYGTVASHLASSTLQASLGLTHPLDASDALALSLVQWFKSDFMTWADPIKCAACGGKTSIVRNERADQRTEEEREGGAGSVEIWKCDEKGCGEETRFPRYNDLRPLLRTRLGRCGEYANLLHLFLLAHSLPARTVSCTTDHIWNAYFSVSQNRWIHLDGCEGAFDTPLLYEKGWGKELGWCFAVGKEGVRDVTRGYTEDYEAGRGKRTGWSEEAVQRAYTRLTQRKRAHMDSTTLSNLHLSDLAETADLADTAGRLARLIARDDKLSGRTSGTKDWRMARNEGGMDSDGVKPWVGEGEVRCFSLAEFKEGDLKLAGSGKMEATSDRHLSLTPCSTSQVGSAAFLLNPPNSSQHLIIELDFRITKQDTNGDGADGMALIVLRGDQVAGVGRGVGGGGLGYDGLGGEGDFAIELDTYRSQDTCNDPPTPHISIHSPPRAHHRHSLACTASDTIPDISDGTTRTLRLELDLTKGEATAWLSDITAAAEGMATDGGGVVPANATASQWIFLWKTSVPAFNRPSMLTIGLTAATGGLAQSHDVSDWRISTR